MEALKSKVTSCGYVEIRRHSDGWYGLWIDGDLKEQSASLSFIEREYAKY